MANALTILRMLLAAGMLFAPVDALGLWALYLLGGASDALDGWVARRTHTESSLGARLDTAADILFCLVCLIRLLPRSPIPIWLWGWIGGIAVLKVVNLLIGLCCWKHLPAMHTALNRLTGLLLYLLPLTIRWVPISISGAVVCTAATMAAVQEQVLIQKGKNIA